MFESDAGDQSHNEHNSIYEWSGTELHRRTDQPGLKRELICTEMAAPEAFVSTTTVVGTA